MLWRPFLMVLTRSASKGKYSNASKKRSLAAEAIRPKAKKSTTLLYGSNNPPAAGDQDPCRNRKELLLALPDDVVVGELRRRPSERNKSPYVADVWLQSDKRMVLVHVPNLDMGGKCSPGQTLLIKPARDKKGRLVGPDAVNPKYGTPKCEYIAQLLRVAEEGYSPVWVGAHPSLGEELADRILRQNLLSRHIPTGATIEREVRNVGGADMRADFVLQYEDNSHKTRIIEVKTVVDTDYAAGGPLPDRHKCVFLNHQLPYQRTALFPWGQSKQKGPDGQAVVSARAIKHVRELTRLAAENYDTTVLFVVIRGDTEAFRPNHEACPTFRRYLREAQQAGVQILAQQVYWGEGSDLGKCFLGKTLPVKWPDEEK